MSKRAADEPADGRRRKRKSRWGKKSASGAGGGGAGPVVLPTNLSSAEQEFRVKLVRFDELNRELMSGAYAHRPPRSPSPPPEYDRRGVRINTRVVRRRARIERELERLVGQMQALNPRWRPPGGPVARRGYSCKVYIPVDEHPDFNFFGHILGPRGSSLKQLQARTGARVRLRGKGSQKEGRRDNYPGANEPLHAVINADTEESMLKAKAEIEALCVVKPEEENEHKRQQLMLLAQLNGTLSGTEFRIGAIAMPKFKAIGFTPPTRPTDRQLSLDKRIALLGIDDNLVDAYKQFMLKVGLPALDITPHDPDTLTALRNERDAFLGRSHPPTAAPAAPASAAATAAPPADDKLAAFLSSV